MSYPFGYKWYTWNEFTQMLGEQYDVRVSECDFKLGIGDGHPDHIFFYLREHNGLNCTVPLPSNYIDIQSDRLGTAKAHSICVALGIDPNDIGIPLDNIEPVDKFAAEEVAE